MNYKRIPQFIAFSLRILAAFTFLSINLSAGTYNKEGNVPPRIVELSAEEEKKLLSEVEVPEGFEYTLFANAAAANYPVYVAASPGGDLYVSSDGNGSVGRDPHRGRVLRLRDNDGDGKADEVKEFIKDIDSPRGLIWDLDRLYLLHPPHISVFFDRDGDGMAEESKRLISDIAFSFKDRPADHSTNGLELGVDGWIYVAGGDFGFMNAVGTDGRELQHRAGGVIRFRPDGSGMELFSTGTRNILGTPMSGELDIFSRDNTNDGGGWDVRLHHFSGLEDHGYPRLYKNFSDEHVAPLADYGGGSGCGSVYISEPGFPDEWNDAPFTCDWGNSGLWRHQVKREGASFIETKKPQRLIKLRRATDADIDGMSAIYQASWYGSAVFKWDGWNNGHIVRVRPKGYKADPIPSFLNLSNAELVKLLESSSQVRRLNAQRALLRRDVDIETETLLLALASNPERSIVSRVAALFALSQRGIDSSLSSAVINRIESLSKDIKMEPFVMRALGDMGIGKVTLGEPGLAPISLLEVGLSSKSMRSRLEAIVSATRQNKIQLAPAIAANLGSEDPVLAHTAFQSLARLKAYNACFEVMKAHDSSSRQRKYAAYALMRMHKPEVVNKTIEILKSEDDIGIRRELISILARLYHRAGEWKGDSWGTRPDTRGPYYQIDTWAESEKIIAVLRGILKDSNPDEVTHTVREMSRNRIPSNDALARIISLAEKDPLLIPDAVAQIAATDDIPAKGIPMLLLALKDEGSSANTLSNSVVSIMKTDSPETVSMVLSALRRLGEIKGAGKNLDAARNAFLESPKLENYHKIVEQLSADLTTSKEGLWANAALITLASKKNVSPEARDEARRTIDLGWNNTKHKIALMETCGLIRSHFLDDRIREAMSDADKEVSKTAEKIAKRIKIKKKTKDATPKVGELSPENALARVMKVKGDVDVGEIIFSKAGCVNCHTVNQQQKQKGPYLGNIADTYKRKDLAEAILFPNKTLAQGFMTNVITLKDGSSYMGFVTDESVDSLSMRNMTSKEHSYDKIEIIKREDLQLSMMPPGLMGQFTLKEMASLLDYLEHLSKK